MGATVSKEVAVVIGRWEAHVIDIGAVEPAVLALGATRLDTW